MESALLVIAGGALVLVIGALYQWVVGPAERERGAADAEALRRAQVEGLKASDKVVEKVVADAVKRIEDRTKVERKLDPVDFANALIKEKEKKP